MTQSARPILACCFIAGSFAACTYNEYTYTGQGGTGDEQSGRAGDTGAGATGGGGSGSGGSSQQAGGGGSSSTEAGAAGEGPSSADGCTGCLQLELPPNSETNLQLAFSSNRNFSRTTLGWRVRVRDFTGDVNISAYAENADPSLVVASSASLTVATGWQDVGIDLEPIEEFREPAFVDAGGFGGGGFDPGNPFDKSRIRAIGLVIQPISALGNLTPAVIEVDRVTFSNLDGGNINFSTDDGDVELVDSDDAELTHVPE